MPHSRALPTCRRFDDVCAMSRRDCTPLRAVGEHQGRQGVSVSAECSVSVVVGAVESSPLIVPREYFSLRAAPHTARRTD